MGVSISSDVSSRGRGRRVRPRRGFGLHVARIALAACLAAVMVFAGMRWTVHMVGPEDVTPAPVDITLEPENRPAAEEALKQVPPDSAVAGSVTVSR